MVVNNELQPDAVHGQRATERATLAYENGTALAQRTVDRFHNAGLATTFRTRPVCGRRQHLSVGFPLIGRVPGARAVTGRQGLPEPISRGRAAGTKYPGHDAPRVTFDSQPQPDLSELTAYKRPHFIEF